MVAVADGRVAPWMPADLVAHGDHARLPAPEEPSTSRVEVGGHQDELREAFNAAIQAIRENGVYAEINDKYFDFDIYGAE